RSRSLPNSEINRAIAREFAIELKGNVLFARYAQLPRLKIFDFRNLNVGAEYNVLEILDDFEIAEPFEDHDIKQTIVDDSVFKKREGPSVKASVANEDRKSTRLNSSHRTISYAVFCLKKKKKKS